MHNYLKILNQLVDSGAEKADRTKTGVRSIFGAQMRFDLNQGFPLLTTKRIFIKGVLAELLWFIRGETNLKFLHQHNCHIWDQWADAKGDLGPIYGQQWRRWPATEGRFVDQLQLLMHQLKTNPDSRRHLISAWNPRFFTRRGLKCTT